MVRVVYCVKVEYIWFEVVRELMNRNGIVVWVVNC
jgi:hypothetical protein